MIGQLKRDQEQLFYSFRLDEVVPDDHLARAIAAVLDLSWAPAELASYYPKIGRPSIDPVLMIRMLIVGYVFAIRSERALCREVQVNLAYRWFCGLSIEDKVPDHSALSRVRNERFGDSAIFRSAPFLLRCMSLLMAHHDGYCAGTECRLSGYCGSSRWHGSSNQLADYDA